MIGAAVRRRPLWILIALFAISIPAVTPRIYAADEIQYFSWLRSITFDHDASFDNEYRMFAASGTTGDPLFRDTFLALTNENGRRPSFATIGPAVLWSPAYALGHLTARLTGAPADGFSQPYISAVAYASAWYGFLAVLLSRAFVGKVLGDGWLPAVAIWLGTPLLFYMYVAPGFAHACSAFAVSLLLWTWLRVRRQWTPAGAAALAACGALVAMMREQDAILLLGPAVDFVRTTIRRSVDARAARPPLSGLLRTAVVAAVVFLVVYSPQIAAYEVLNGHFGPTYLVLRKMTWTSPHFLQVAFSPEHGLFFWTPLAAVSVVGLARLLFGVDRGHDRRWIAALALLMIVLQIYISGCVESWTVAGAFGQRRFVAITPLLTLGLAATRPSRPRTPPGAFWMLLLAAGIWWNVGLMAQFGLHTMDRQALSIRQNAWVTFVDLPRQAPRLIWRYLTNRQSFYGLPYDGR
jgi:hypothetical protein